MDRLVDVLISVDAETAKALECPEERAAMGRLISQVLRARAMRATLAGASLGAKVEVQAAGIDNAKINAEFLARTARALM